jgi:hypothetical protein
MLGGASFPPALACGGVVSIVHSQLTSATCLAVPAATGGTSKTAPCGCLQCVELVSELKAVCKQNVKAF